MGLSSVGGSIFPPINTTKSGVSGEFFGKNKIIYQVGGDADQYPFPYLVINIEEIFNWTRNTWSKDKSLRDRFNISPLTKIGLSFYSRDDILDVLAEQDICRVCDFLEEYKFDFIFSPNFSLYKNWPVLQCRINMKLSKLYAIEFLARRWNVIHDVVWQTETDKRRVWRWIEENGIDVVSLTYQTVKATTKSNYWNIEARGEIEELLNASVEKVVVLGCTSKARMRDMVSWFGDKIIFVDTRLYRMSRFGRGFGGTSNYNKTACFLESTQRLKEYYESIR